MFIRLPAIALSCACLLATPALAQPAFTEFALPDSALNTGSLTDFWIASAAPADVDGDGDLDLLIAGYFVVYPTETDDGSVEERLTLYRNDGPAGSTWQLTPVPVPTAGLSFTAADLAWADVDLDGDPDVAIGSQGVLTMYRNDAGTLVPTGLNLATYLEDQAFTTMDQRSLTWADVDNDGDPDLLAPSILDETGWDWGPTRLFRNDGAAIDGSWIFTDVPTTLPLNANGVSAWSDADHDGDLDLLLGHVSPWGDAYLTTWRNDAGTLAAEPGNLAMIRYGTADWGDADGDGDLDVVVAGNLELPDETGETVVRVLFGDGQGGWTPLEVASSMAPMPGGVWLDFSAVTWADYDSDGDVDLLVSGEWLGPETIEGHAVVYVNDGGAFAPAGESLPAPAAGNAGGAFTWFDIDGDRDLDYFVAGGYVDAFGLLEARTQLFRNDAPAPNQAPTAPASLTAGPAGDDVTLSWSPSSDDATPQAAITYELEVVPYGGGAAMPVAERHALPQPGNVAGRTAWTLRGLSPGAYSWTVRALDNAFAAGPAASGTFVVGGADVDDVGIATPLALSAPKPHPVRARSVVTLAVRSASRVTVAVYDAAGRRVMTVHDGPLTAGRHAIPIDGARLGSGTFFVRADDGRSGDAVRVISVR